MSWQTVQLDAVAVLDRQSVHPAEADPETPYLGLEHVDGEGRIRCTETIRSAELKSNKFRFTDQHVLFGKLRPYLRKIARPHFAGVCSTDIIPILPQDVLSRDYLFHLLRTPAMVDLATSRSSGANLPRLSPKQLATFPIPLPPLAEQKRIAGILDAADALRAKRRVSLAQLDTLLQSTFLDLFGDPVTNPMGWEIANLGAVANFHAGSTLPPGDDFVDQANGFLYLKVGDLNHPDNSTEIVRANLWYESSQKGIVAPTNAVVIPKRGGAIGTNKKRLLTRPAVLDPNLMAISAGEKINHHFILRWFHTFDLTSITSGSSVPQLNKKDLAPLRIPHPPIDLQHQFATIVESVERQKARLRAHLAELDALFASLQSRAFNGEL